MSRFQALRAGLLHAEKPREDSAQAAAYLAAAIAIGLLFAVSLSMFGGPLTESVRDYGLKTSLIAPH